VVTAATSLIWFTNLSKSVLFITGDSIAPAMAGPGIRTLELAQVTNAEHNVHVVTTGKYEPVSYPFPVHSVGARELRRLVKQSDVLVVQGFALLQFPWLKHCAAKLVVDAYDPIHLEQLTDLAAVSDTNARKQLNQTIAALTEQLRYADFIICASEKQRDFWLGYLSAIGRVNATTYAKDESLRSLIDVVPFGVARTPAKQTRHALRNTIPGIGDDDFVMIWGGGIYNWFDPLSLITAVGLVAKKHKSVRLFFMGTVHPNPLFKGYEMTQKAVELSNVLGLTDKHVFFNDSWVQYQERADYLLEANVGVSTHFIHLETQFSFRTRILDYLWAGLPILTTTGDSFAEIISQQELGLVVPEQNPLEIANAIKVLIEKPAQRLKMQQRSRHYGENLVWVKISGPLLSFISNADSAPDIIRSARPVPLKLSRDNWIKAKFRGLILAYRAGGIRLVMARAINKLRPTKVDF
jgi:glycosyltransferase involved in cell wall biosynthesis